MNKINHNLTKSSKKIIRAQSKQNKAIKKIAVQLEKNVIRRTEITVVFFILNKAQFIQTTAGYALFSNIRNEISLQCPSFQFWTCNQYQE